MRLRAVGVGLAAWALCLVGLMGCAAGAGEAAPTRALAARAPAAAMAPATATAVPPATLTPTPTWTPAPSFGAAQDGSAPLGAAPTATAVPPTPLTQGVAAVAAVQRAAPDAGPLDLNGLRPPPMPVPVTIHPDDHYWLARPLGAGYRNFDLEWYPYGNTVLLPDRDPYRVHHGVDFPNPQGTPVLAAGGGVVLHAGPLPSPRDGLDYYGNTVIIEHDWQWRGQPVYTLYAHTLELFVQAGDRVTPGQLIAGVGNSGEVSGSHLHFEVRVGSNSYGDTRNPALWLAPFTGWGTLAGRFVDKNGRFISGATITVLPLDRGAPERQQRTYESGTVRPDEVWRENFVVGDLPAGRYRLLVTVDDVTYQRDVTVLPGQTSFEIIGAEFEFVPTPTPEPGGEG